VHAGENAATAHVGRLVLTHLQPGSDPSVALDAAARAYPGEITVARPGTVVDLEES
jgi:ribonuclease BN (tRNA processing enzyme)